ncbi:ATP phosphoribosyltransferase, partial [Anaerolineae bacterium CFX9]|nr:ATP phosphoribosyltransferase [Anaerolineae bacterium CFX9]
QEISERVAANPLTHGLQGPTIAPIYGIDDADNRQWFTITITVSNRQLLSSIEHLRALGARQATVTPVRYLFLETSPSYRHLLEMLDKQPESQPIT